MVRAITKPLTFEEFVNLDNDEPDEYELVAGNLLLMPEPSDWHEEILEFLSFMFELQYRRQKLNYSVRKRNALMLGPANGRRPDIAVIERPANRREDRQPGIRTVPMMLVEIASTNWATDLVEKQEEYQALGVPEYWIVDYRGQIPAKYCLRGKGPKVIALRVEHGKYQRVEYLPGESVVCHTFPELQLTVDQILAAEE